MYFGSRPLNQHIVLASTPQRKHGRRAATGNNRCARGSGTQVEAIPTFSSPSGEHHNLVDRGSLWHSDEAADKLAWFTGPLGPVGNKQN